MIPKVKPDTLYLLNCPNASSSLDDIGKHVVKKYNYGVNFLKLKCMLGNQTASEDPFSTGEKNPLTSGFCLQWERMHWGIHSPGK